MRKAVALILALLCVLSLAGCHGSRGLPAFVIPEEFDTTREYEITFWAKNDTNITQVGIYEQAIADFEEAGKTDPLFAELDRMCKANNGLWNPEAEKYLLANAKSI